MTTREDILVSIVMPAYNEAGNIEKTVTDCAALLARENIPGEIIVANDGSTDATPRILRKLKERFENFHYIDLETNQGYGAAMKKAIDLSSGTYVATTDSDGQFDIGDVPRMLEKIREGYDCVTGFRAKKKDTLPRRFANWGYNLLVRAVCGVRFTDGQCALKVYKGDVLRGLPVEARGFTFPTETLIKLDYQGCKVTEVPVTHHFREAGASKLKFFRTVWIMFTFLLYIRFKLALHRKKVIYRI